MDKELVRKMRQYIKQNDLNSVKQMIDNDRSLLNVITTFGSWLHDAATYGQYNIALYLVECGIDVNVKGGVRKCGAITSAAFEGHLDIIKMLCDNGAILDTSTAAANPIFAAIYNGNFEIVKFLCERDIDITASYPIGQLDNVDAYEYARQFGQMEIANYLKDKLQERNN